MRQGMLFNDGWKFHKGDAAGADDPAFNDRGWRSQRLPHDWSIEGPFDERWASATGYLPGGIGWYRKTFRLPEAFAAEQVSLHFDGVYCHSDVWLNGRHLGQRPNGFVSFRYDLTPYLNATGDNTVAVRVDHHQYADCRWYTGSGIYRNVYLIGTDAVHIKQWGIFATTPVVTADRAEVHVTVTVQNETEATAEVRIELELVDEQRMVAAHSSTAAVVAGGQEATVECGLNVAQPRLWSVEQPELYVLRTRILREGQVIDQEDTPIGIRTIRFDPDTGFYLNGEGLKLKGACLHDDAGALGAAVPPKVWERRLRLLKAAGVNAIRMAHNPHMPELYDLCDQLGLLVQDEAFDEWEGGKNKWIAGWNVGQPGNDGYHEHFREWAEADLRDMILRDRNHPSVIMWSIGNEIDYPNDPYSHEILDVGTNPQSFGRGFRPDNPHADRLGKIARRLVAIAKQYDTTRPITAALAAALISNETGFADALDVVGYNYQEPRYEADHAKYPNRVIYGSENGMGWGAWKAVADNPFISAQFLWTGIDYLGEAHQWPGRSSGAGILDLAGFLKPEYHFRRSIWTDDSMIYIGTRDVPQSGENVSLWSHQKAEPVWSGAPGSPVRVICFTNCAQAELFLNGRSLGVKEMAASEGHLLWWDVVYEPGTLSVHGINNGVKTASDEIKTSGPPKQLLAEADCSVLTADGVDLAHVTVTVADENGVLVYDATQEVTWTIEGPARLLGLESGDQTSAEDYLANKRRMFHGRQLGYVQATETPGTVTVRLAAPGLAEQNLTLRMARSV